ncbi:putative ribonuclease H-like domain-containing protein [Tanacetum coccineum]
MKGGLSSGTKQDLLLKDPVLREEGIDYDGESFAPKELCDEFEKLMKDKFQMSSMGELTFFLGLQVQQRKKDIFISQDKYVHEILRKFNYSDVKSASTPTDLEKPCFMKESDDVDDIIIDL